MDWWCCNNLVKLETLFPRIPFLVLSRFKFAKSWISTWFRKKCSNCHNNLTVFLQTDMVTNRCRDVLWVPGISHSSAPALFPHWRPTAVPGSQQMLGHEPTGMWAIQRPPHELAIFDYTETAGCGWHLRFAG